MYGLLNIMAGGQGAAPVPPTPTLNWFYVENAMGVANTVSIKKYYSGAPTLTIETSTDGNTWTTLGTTSTTARNISVPAHGRVYLRCNATNWSIVRFGSVCYNTITATGNFNVGGNIMSLLYGSNFTGRETTFPSGSTYTFSELFAGNVYLKDASRLELPATTLAGYCYQGMFSACTSLTAAPELPSTTLADNCYNSMFYRCTLLASAPALPATTLASYCYASMFERCSSLTAAPVLSAATLAQWCYGRMFYLCSSLDSVTCLATDISASDCTYYWMYDTKPRGTFYKAASMSSWSRGENGIPSSWTVRNA